jgi:hypothetical protein
MTTCGNWGTCNPCASVSCNYQPTAPYAACGIDFDGHIWGTRLEGTEGTWLRDANGNTSCCPDKFVTRVFKRTDCVGVWGSTSAFQCCLEKIGGACYSLVPNHCGLY